MITQQDEERFWGQVDRITTPDGCWPWVGTTTNGYGVIWVNGRMRKAHRVALELAGWIIPAEFLEVRHYSCDNRPCCRPDHLKIGTPQDNRDDMTSKGRQAHGERHGSARLDPAKVVEIRALYQPGARGHSYGALAKQFGVTKVNIYYIVSGKTWKNVA